MLFAIVLSLIYVEIKDAVLQKFFSNVISEFWNEWELRAMIVLSLLLQYFLVYCGKIRRKYRGRWLPIVRVIAWSVYLIADWMPTVVLSNLLRGENIDRRSELIIWTSFILWHLGGPYNITAYTIEDNELWLRRLFALVVQVGEAIYICIKFRSPIMPLNLVAAPIFVIGVLRYIERVWALGFASQKQLRNSLTKKDATEETKIVRTGLVNYVTIQEYLRGSGIIPQVTFLRETHLASIIHQPLLTHLPFRVAREFHDDMVFTKSKSADEAFRFVGAELHFFYDLLYTKIPINVSHHKLSFSLRIFSFLTAVCSLLAFTLIHKHRPAAVDNHIKQTGDPDIAVTYLLLIGAIALEVIAFSVDALAMAWTRIWLPIPQKWIDAFLQSMRTKKRIKTMGQHDLIDYFIQVRKSKFFRVIRNLFGNYLPMFRYSQWNPIDQNLKEFIYAHLKMKRDNCKEKNFNLEFVSKLLDEFKGGQVFKRVCEKKNLPQIVDDDWKMDTTDFSRCVILWHIATDIVYYDDLSKHRVSMGGKYLKIGKCLSDYMTYLVVACPLMLPLGFSEASHRDTYKEAEFFFRKQVKEDSREATKQSFASLLLHRYTDTGIDEALYRHREIGKSRDDEEDYSELSNGRSFAEKLQELARNERWDHEEKWELISEVWMEMMTYAATYCSWKEHAHAMRRGGELLTLVSLLMAHFGLSTQIRIREKADKDAENKVPFTTSSSFW